MYRIMRAGLVLAVIAALVLAGLLYLKYRAGERQIRRTVKLDLPTAATSYVPSEEDPYYALYGVDPLATIAPDNVPTPAPTAAPSAEMATVPPEATVEPTPAPSQTPGVPAVDERFTFARQVTCEGKTYAYNPDITALLFLGIDSPDAVTARAFGFGKGDQTDVILLAAIDAEKKTVTLLNISRDTMTDVDVLSYDHKTVVGTKVMQIALAHAYGDGAELSGLLEAEAVSRLLGGLPVNGYLSINYGALPVLNDAVGGVTVTLEEDMEISGQAYAAGESVKLLGEMAPDYVRNRSIGQGTNSERMGRQEGYIHGFIARCVAQDGNPASLVLGMYDGAKEYIATSLTQDELVYLGATVLGSGWSVEIVDAPGELRLGEIYEFYPDEAALSRILLDIFYTSD